MSPIVPGFSSKPALIERTVEACAAHGVRIAGGNVMHLEEWRAHALFHLARARAPGAGAGLQKPYRGKSAPAAYMKEVARALGTPAQGRQERPVAPLMPPSSESRE